MCLQRANRATIEGGMIGLNLVSAVANEMLVSPKKTTTKLFCVALECEERNKASRYYYPLYTVMADSKITYVTHLSIL